MREVTVARLGLDSGTNGFVVILRERDGSRLLPIWIGRPEAEAIAMELNQVVRERPLTHDLCKSLIGALGGGVRRVCITRVEAQTYFAELQLDGPHGVVHVDARPSDSIAVALRVAAPIFVDDALLADPDDAQETSASAGAGPAPSQPGLTADQLKAYLAALRPEDFGKFRP